MPTLQGVYADLVGQEHVVEILQKAVLATRTGEETQDHQDLDDHLLPLPSHKHLSALTMDAAHATNVNPQQTAHTPMLKSFAPKVFL